MNTGESLCPDCGHELCCCPDDIPSATIESLCAELALVTTQLKAQQEPVAWEGAEEWERLAYELCAEEHGEDACNELLWDGGVIPEPWGERWLKYESESKRLIALVRKFASPPNTEAVAWMVEENVTMREDFAALLGFGGAYIATGRAIPQSWKPLLFLAPPQLDEYRKVLEMAREVLKWQDGYNAQMTKALAAINAVLKGE